MLFAHFGKSYFSDLFEERVGPNSTLSVPIVSNMGDELQRNGLVVVVLVVLGKESVDFGFAPANTPYRKTFGGNCFVILYPSCWIVDPICLPIYQTKAGKAHGFNRGMIGRTLELLWEKFQNNFVYIHVFVTTWHLKYDIIDI